MASSLKNLSEYDETTIPDASAMHIGIVLAEWNADITHRLYEACEATLKKYGCKKLTTVQVPGAFELTAGASLLINNKKPDAVICIGCVIKGQTSHNEYINHSVAHGITSLTLQTGIPVIFGVLTPNDHQQALERAGGQYGNKGVEAAVTAIRMAALKNTINDNHSTIGF